MIGFVSRQKNDCAPIALANWLELDYEHVCKEVNYKSECGVSHYHACKFMREHGMARFPVPRRGQDKMTGIIQFKYPGRRLRHLAVVRNGLVFETSTPDGMPIKDWKRKFGNPNVTDYWRNRKARPEQVEYKEDVTAWLDDLLGEK